MKSRKHSPKRQTLSASSSSGPNNSLKYFSKPIKHWNLFQPHSLKKSCFQTLKLRIQNLKEEKIITNILPWESCGTIWIVGLSIAVMIIRLFIGSYLIRFEKQKYLVKELCLKNIDFIYFWLSICILIKVILWQKQYFWGIKNVAVWKKQTIFLNFLWPPTCH